MIVDILGTRYYVIEDYNRSPPRALYKENLSGIYKGIHRGGALRGLITNAYFPPLPIARVGGILIQPHTNAAGLRTLKDLAF